jgi:hypothetical protein
MFRRAVVLLGLAVLLSLLFPVPALLRQGGVDPQRLQLPGVDLAALCALVAVLPALLLARDGKLRERIPRWNVWIALLALCSLAFLLLHVSLSHEFAAAWLHEQIAAGNVPLHVSAGTLLHAGELAMRVGVLVCTMGVLLSLHSVPDEAQLLAQRRRRKKK